MPLSQTFSVLSSLGVVVQLGGALMLIGLFLMLRHFAPRRTYFVAWTAGWACLAAAILALVVSSFVVPALIGRPLGASDPAIRLLYLVYQTTKVLGFVLFVRGTATYVAGVTGTVIATNWLWAVGVLFAMLSTAGSPHGLNEMIIWQSAAAVPAFGYCASVLLGLPRPRRTAGSIATGAAFALLAALWLVYAGAFGLSLYDLRAAAATHVRTIIAFNAYLDLTLDVVLGYAMIRLLMEDAKREVDDAQAELRVTHDQLRRAALYDALTDSLNRRAFAEGVGLDMVRATFGTVVLADLDNLKQVNDRFGHAMGDRLIRHCADVLRTTLRPYDKLYRWGGDEFLLIVPSAHAADVMERLQRAVAGADPIDPAAVGAAGAGEEPSRLRVSLGAADYASSAELPGAIERADRAMYQEKSRRKSESRADVEPRGGPAEPPTSVAGVR